MGRFINAAMIASSSLVTFRLVRAFPHQMMRAMSYSCHHHRRISLLLSRDDSSSLLSPTVPGVHRRCTPAMTRMASSSKYMADHITDVMAPPGIAAFFQGWQLYQSVIQNNLMEHREIGIALRSVFESIAPGFSVLDLGCGDSSTAIKALEGFHVSSYTGVDLTAPALEIARTNFRGTYSANWVHANMVDYIASSDQQFDVIMTSFAMHHLPSDIKQAWLMDIAKHLTPSGFLVLMDTCCPAGMSRDDTVQIYLDLVADWPLSHADKAAIATHMWSSDFPEGEAFMNAALMAAGLIQTTIYKHPHGLQVGYVLLA